MILNTGMRTDIPAFYSKWFVNRLKEGYVLVRNPYYPSQVTKYYLNNELVDLLTFCTKNPGPMLEHMDMLKGYGQYWFVTITGYGKDIEPNVPDKNKVMDDFKKLSDIVGVDKICWRYDPIFVSEKYSIKWHLETFEKMAKNLCGYTKACVISFIDLYKKVERNFPEAKAVSEAEQLELGKGIIEIARKYGMIIRPCGEGDLLRKYGADTSGCMTKEVFENALHTSLSIPPRSKDIRKDCECLLGTDIGAYDTCMHLCRYCYANTDKRRVYENYRKHNPDSPFLLGESEEGDEIHIAKQYSFVDGQIKLDI